MPDAPYYTRQDLNQHFQAQGVHPVDAAVHSGDIESLPGWDAPQPYAAGGSVSPSTMQLAPLGGWGWGYMNGSTPAAGGTQASPLPADPPFKIAAFNPGGHTTTDTAPDATTPSGNPGAATALRDAASWGSLAAQATKDRQLGQVAGVLGTAADASAGQYGSLGGTLGGLATRTPLGALIGSLVGQEASVGGANTRNLANTVASAIPGVGPLYGAANFISDGALGRSLFGTDVTPTASGGYTPAVAGLLGSLGAQTTPAIEASNAAAAANNPDYSNEGRAAPTNDPSPSPSPGEG